MGIEPSCGERLFEKNIRFRFHSSLPEDDLDLFRGQVVEETVVEGSGDGVGALVQPEGGSSKKNEKAQVRARVSDELGSRTSKGVAKLEVRQCKQCIP